MNPNLLAIFSEATVMVFMLMLMRISGMMATAPFFTQLGIPIQVRIFLIFTLGMVMFPIYSTNAAPIWAKDLWSFGWLAFQELAIGLMLGFVAQLVFASVQMAGGHISVMIGLNMAQALDPTTQVNSPAIGQFYSMLALMLFMTLNIHHSLIMAVAKSFEFVPLATGIESFALLAQRFTGLGSHAIVLSMLLVLPVMGIILVKEVALAFMAKLMPQMNIMMVSLPGKIMLGLLLISITLPYTAEALGKAYEELTSHLMILFRT